MILLFPVTYYSLLPGSLGSEGLKTTESRTRLKKKMPGSRCCSCARAASPIIGQLKVEPFLRETERVIFKDCPDRYFDENTARTGKPRLYIFTMNEFRLASCSQRAVCSILVSS